MQEEIIEMARRLGKALAQSPQAAAMRSARKELAEHKDILEALQKYQHQADKIAELEMQQKPVEVADKHAMAELQDKLAASDVFKRFTSAQVEYVDMMRKVTQALRQNLAEVEGEAQQ